MPPISNTLKRLLVLACSLALLLYALAPPTNAPATIADKVLVLKSAHQLILMKNGVPLKTYAVSLGRSPFGPKTRTGDHRTPEGNYVLDWRNPQSKFHLSIHVSYPSSSDLVKAHHAGVAPGGDIMVHGLQNGLGWIGRFHRLMDWTDGCIAVTNAEMDQIWRAVRDGTPIEIRP